MAVTPRRAEVLDDRRVGEGGVGAAEVVGDVGVEHRQTPDVGLVDDRLVHRVIGGRSLPQSKNGSLTTARGTCGALSAVLGSSGSSNWYGEAGVVPIDVAVDRLGVRVEQQLGRVAPQALVRVPRAVDPVAVALAGADVGEVGVPAVAVDLGTSTRTSASPCSVSSSRHSSTPSATLLNSEKLVPDPS